jgi:hypothetical protein
MNPPAMLAITSHGNAPYLMVARVARALGNRPVVIPWYYGETQRRILREEIPDGMNTIFLSKELGDLFWPLLLDAKNGGEFTQFAQKVSDPVNPNGVVAIENRLAGLLKEGIPAVSLDGSIRRKFYPSDFNGVLNTTLPLRVSLPNHSFFFTALMSGVYGTAPDGEDDPLTRRAVQDLQFYARLWKQAEDTFDIKFTPRINALSYREEKADGVILTPPLAIERPTVHGLKSPSVLFSPSGTRTDVEKLNAVASQIPAEYQKLVTTGFRSEADFPGGEYQRVYADSYADPHLKCVIARGGWGTIWECLMNLKPLVVVRTTFIEDPEMGHTQKVLQQLGLAILWNGPDDPFLNEEMLGRIQRAMQKERDTDDELFGRFSRDGYQFIAEHILEYER